MNHCQRSKKTQLYVHVQTALGVMSRAQSVSNFAVGACGQAVLGCGKTAPSSLSLNATSLAAIQPLTDGIMTSKSNTNAISTFAFSASSDPGANTPRLPPPKTQFHLRSSLSFSVVESARNLGRGQQFLVSHQDLYLCFSTNQYSTVLVWNTFVSNFGGTATVPLSWIHERG